MKGLIDLIGLDLKKILKWIQKSLEADITQFTAENNSSY